MGLFKFLVFVVLAVLVTAAAIWVIGYLAPDHPTIIDRGLWVLCVLVIFLMLANAVGVVGHGPMIPRFR